MGKHSRSKLPQVGFRQDGMSWFQHLILKDLKQIPIVDIDQEDGESFYVYKDGEIQYVIAPDCDHEGELENVSWLIENHPGNELVMYTRQYLSEFIEFNEVVSKMDKLMLTYTRDKKIDNLLG